MKPYYYNSGREKLDSWGIWPKSAIGRFTVYLVGLDLLFRLVRTVAGSTSKLSLTLSPWITLVTFIICVLLIFLALRWSKNHLLWRLRNRLIVTYVFIGVIPVVLILLIGFIAGYLFAGQFATFVATKVLDEQVRALHHANTDVALDLANQLKAGTVFSAPALKRIGGIEHLGSRFQEADLLVSDGRQNIVLRSAHPEQAQALVAPQWLTHDFSGLAVDNGKLYLRSVVRVPAKSSLLTVMTSAPIQGSIINEIAGKTGEVRIFPLNVEPDEDTNGVRASSSKPKEGTVFQAGKRSGDITGGVAAGNIPPSRGWWDQEVHYGMPVASVSWETGPGRTQGLGPATVLVGTRISTLYGQLFFNLGRNANVVILALVGITIFFGVIELFALLIGVGLTRTITRSVANLYEATEHVNRGDLKHRIAVKSNDQLAALQKSFNSMSASIERLLLEQKEKERLQSELEIAQEVQSQLFPRVSHNMRTLEVHGICKPARTVSGDYYDFLQLGEEQLGIAMGDISGKGISAALLMATVHSAVRAYELGRMPGKTELVAAGAAAISAASGYSYRSLGMTSAVAESPGIVLSLLNQHLFHSTPAEKYATLFLSIYDGESRTLTYSNAGHLPPLLVASDGNMRRLDVGGTVIGLFENLTWEEQKVQMHPGEMFVAFSDGITEPENEFGEFGEERLIELLHENRHLPLARISEIVIAAVQDWIGNQEQPDDLTLVLARAQ
jgi:phosphoserine phosphatase RsbU/P